MREWLSIAAVTTASGVALQINTYDEYGRPGANNFGRFQYTGQAWLGEIGLYYYKARAYSPAIGLFLKTDPIGFAGGLNLYNHFGGDPVNATDPSGLAFPQRCPEYTRIMVSPDRKFSLPPANACWPMDDIC